MNPERRWRYSEPTSADDPTPIEITMTEAQVLVEYFSYWVGRMHRIGKSREISYEACIEDWVATHWATPVE